MPDQSREHLAALLAAYCYWHVTRAAHARSYRRAAAGECPMAELANAASIAAAAGRAFHGAFRAAKAALDNPLPACGLTAPPPAADVHGNPSRTTQAGVQ